MNELACRQSSVNIVTINWNSHAAGIGSTGGSKRGKYKNFSTSGNRNIEQPALLVNGIFLFSGGQALIYEGNSFSMQPVTITTLLDSPLALCGLIILTKSPSGTSGWTMIFLMRLKS